MRHDPPPHLLLRLLSSNPASSSNSGSFLACNPVIDVTATAGDGYTVWFWRAGQQSISKYWQSNHKATAVRWKEDGEFLATAWTDGIVRLIGLDSSAAGSKAVHHIRVVGEGKTARINFIAWSRNLIVRRPNNKGDEIETLARSLKFLELEGSFPKLSPLPVAGGSGVDMFVFSTTSSLDSVFRPCGPAGTESVHVMIAGTTDGAVHLTMYDSFVIGAFRPALHTGRENITPQDNLELCGHASHPDISTHALLLRPKEDPTTSLFIVPMDLMFVYKSPVDLSLIASKTTTLQNLLRYLKQTQSHMGNTFQETREMPRRYLSSLQAYLEDGKETTRGPMSAVAALTQTAGLGNAPTPVKDWLKDTVAETGHKRWDKAVVSGLKSLLAFIHENLIPALERCQSILSRLSGNAQYHDGRESIGFTDPQIKRLEDVVSCLYLVSHQIESHVKDEQENFAAFSSWLRFEIDRNSSSTMSEELSEKEVTLDTRKVLAYIQKYLETSPLALYFGGITTEDYNKDLQLSETASSLVELVQKQVDRHRVGLPCMKAVPNVSFLVDYLTRRAEDVFRGIAEAQQRGVRFGQAVEISFGFEVKSKIVKHDMHMCANTTKNGNLTAVTFTAVVLQDDGPIQKYRVYILRSETPIINGISGNTATTVCRAELADSTSVLDLKFLDESSLLVLGREEASGESVVLRIAYQAPSLSYSAYDNAATIPTSSVQAVPLRLSPDQQHPFSPVRMEVQKGSNRREEITDRVCLLGNNGFSFRTYSLPES